MARSVFGDQHVQDSVAEFNPQHLSVVADRVGRRVSVGGPVTPTPPPRTADEPKER